MTNKDQYDSKLDRRLFLRLLSGSALAFAASGTLIGCGGGGSSNNSNSGPTGPIQPPANTHTVNGTVNLQQIGGTSLSVQSVYSQPSPVSAAGAFSTFVSNMGAQLLFVTDATGKVHGLGVSSPASTTLTIDATSTAVALVLLSPGITASDATESAAHISQISSLNSFGTLVTYLASNLTTASLTDLASNTNFTTVLTASVNEWASTHVSEVRRSHAAATDGTFTASFTTITPPNNASVQITNSAWRVITVARQLLGADNNPLPGAIIHPGSHDGAVTGIAPTSWGTIFASPTGTATTDSDTSIDLTNPSTQAALQYIANGPGFAAGSTTLPTGLDAQAAWGQTFVTYLAFPQLDLVTGNLNFLSLLGKVPTVWQGIASSVTVGSALTSGTGDQGTALAGSLSQIYTALAASADTVKLFGLPATVVALPQALNALSSVVSSGNGAIALKTWTHYTQVESVSLTIASGTVTVQ